MKCLSTTFAIAALFLGTEVKAVLAISSTVTHETCTYASGAIVIYVSGGVQPYTFAWADGPTVAGRDGLSAGAYSVTVTDANLDQVVENVTVLSLGYDIELFGSYPFCGQGGQLFSDDLVPLGAVGPWYAGGTAIQLAPGFSGGPPNYYAIYPQVAPNAPFSMSFADGNGCTGTISGTLGTQITVWPTISVSSVEPSCTTENIGAIHLQSSGPNPDGGVFLHLLDQNAQPVFMTSNVDGALEAHFTDLPPGTYGVHWWLGMTMEFLDPGLCSYDTLWVTVPNLGPNCGHVTGTSWYDADADCVRDANEVGIPYSPLEIQPGGDVVLTDQYGGYYIPLVNGSYTLAQQDPTLVPICPATLPVPFTVNTNSTTIDLANGSTEPLDLRAQVASGAARPGFTVNIHASATNLSPQFSGPVTFTLDIDPALVINTVNPTPTSAMGNTLTWNLPAFASFQGDPFHVNAQVPVGTPLGTVLMHTATVSTLTDANPGNDVAALPVTVTGSFDPNDKSVRTSTGWSDTQYIIGDDAWLDYTIRFQNTGTDTAFTVAISDTLDADLDMGTFEQGVASHGFSVQFLPGRIVRWTFANILLADSNTNEALSHGLVNFRIRPVQPLLPGTEISNNADIFFDFNTPVRTNDAVVVAETSTQVAVDRSSGQGLTVYPNPVSDELRFKLPGISGPFAVKLIAVDGRVVRSERTAQNQIDVSMLRPGMYALRVNDSTVRFVKD